MTPFDFMELELTLSLKEWQGYFLLSFIVIWLYVFSYVFLCPWIHKTHKNLRIQIYDLKEAK